MNRDANTLRVKLNLGNFADPFYNVAPVDRADISKALMTCIQNGEVESDRNGGWQLTAKGRENQPKA
jgi:hypothetical protein